MRLAKSVRVGALATSIALLLAASAHAADAPLCPGDLDSDGAVTTDELVTAVNKSIQGCDLLPVELNFRGQVGDQPFQCGTAYDGIGTASSRWLPADFRFYVSDVRLVRADHTEVPVQLEKNVWQSENTALLDFEDGTAPCNNGTTQTNTVVRGLAPKGEYTGVHFTLGVPFAENHQDAAAAPSPLNLTSMFWGWRGGYKFLRVDSFIVLDSDFAEFRIHLGSTGCRYGRPLEVAGCVWPNRADVLLADFDLANDAIVADIGAVVADSDLTSNVPETPPGCMADRGDTDCDPVLRNLGVDVSDGLPSPMTQKFFRVEPRAPSE